MSNADEMALNEQVEVENDLDTTPVSEEEATEDSEIESEESQDFDQPEEVEEETEDSSKKGYSNRVRELNAKKKEAESEAQSLRERLAEFTGGDADYQPQQFQPEEPLVKPGEEIDAVEFDRRLRAREARILQQADARAMLRSKQQEALARIDRETDEVMRSYPELDKDSDSFNRELSDAISEATEAYVLKNPYSASVKSFVDKMMRPYKGAVSEEVGKMTSSVAKQVSQAATRPTSVRAKEKPAEEKTIAELEAELGVVQA